MIILSIRFKYQRRCLLFLLFFNVYKNINFKITRFNRFDSIRYMLYSSFIKISTFTKIFIIFSLNIISFYTFINIYIKFDKFYYFFINKKYNYYKLYRNTIKKISIYDNDNDNKIFEIIILFQCFYYYIFQLFFLFCLQYLL